MAAALQNTATALTNAGLGGAPVAGGLLSGVVATTEGTLTVTAGKTGVIGGGTQVGLIGVGVLSPTPAQGTLAVVNVASGGSLASVALGTNQAAISGVATATTPAVSGATSTVAAIAPVAAPATSAWATSTPIHAGPTLRGSATVAAVQASYPLILTATRNLTLTGSLDSLDSSNAFLGQTITDERARALRASAAFVQSFAAGKGSASVGITVSQGLDGIGARVLAPGYAHASFHRLTVQAAASHAFDRWTVRLRATGQAADGTIPASEQISLGGDDFGRAFKAGVATDDDGAAASAELAYGPKQSRPILKGLETYVFADAGRSRTFSRPALALSGHTSNLASVGVGVRVTVADHTAFQVEMAHPLVDDTPYSKDSDWWLIAGLQTSY